MAKRKAATSSGRTAARKKTVAKKATKKAVRRTPARKAKTKSAASKAAGGTIKLGDIRRQLERGAGALSAVLASSRDAQPKLAEKQALISRIAAELQDICDEDMQQICGPDMAIPV